MDLLIILNVVLFGTALVMSLQKLRGAGKWLSVPSAFISLYVFSVYFAALINIIPEYEIRFYMRWFNLVIAAYLIMRAKHD